MNKSRPVLITFSILAGLQILNGGAALEDVIGAQAFGLFALAVAAVQVGMTFYVQNQTIPSEDAAAYINKEGQVVAGPAAGITTGESVQVVKTVTPMHISDTFDDGGFRGEEGYFDPRWGVGLIVVSLIVLALILGTVF